MYKTHDSLNQIRKWNIWNELIKSSEGYLEHKNIGCKKWLNLRPPPPNKYINSKIKSLEYAHCIPYLILKKQEILNNAMILKILGTSPRVNKSSKINLDKLVYKYSTAPHKKNPR